MRAASLASDATWSSVKTTSGQQAIALESPTFATTSGLLTTTATVAVLPDLSCFGSSNAASTL